MALSRRTLLKTAGVLAGSVAGGFALRGAKAASPAYLRPPGAGDEERFLSRCIRCAQCIEACPTQVLHPAGADGGIALGTPLVNAREQPCDLCMGREQMECIAACPVEALEPIRERRDVRMGVAVILAETCLPFVGVSCKACWHACPFPREAISFDPLGRPVVVQEACVGCGLCVHVCLTEPASIRVRPGTQHSMSDS